jgi:hypothetical protein
LEYVKGDGRLSSVEIKTQLILAPITYCAESRRALNIIIKNRFAKSPAPRNDSGVGMKIMSYLASRFVVVIAVSLVVNAYADTRPAEPFAKDALHQVEARVEAIDKAKRTLSLRGPNGLATIVASPEVRNFNNIHVGDKVHAGYYEGIAAEIKAKSSSAQSEPVEATAIYRAPAGSRPAGALGHAINATVKIESVDTKAGTVTFKRADGFVRTLAVESPEGRKFIGALNSGDEVEVTYIEAVAIEVVPAQ